GLASAAGGAAWLRLRDRGAGTPPRTRHFVLGEVGASLPEGMPALTPDGDAVVFAPAGGGRLLVRSLGTLTARPLSGTEGARAPFISPDGRWVGFFTAGDQVKRVPLDGSAAPNVLGSVSRLSTGSWGGGA